MPPLAHIFGLPLLAAASASPATGISPLTFIFGLPLLAALVMALIPGNFRFVIRCLALLATFSSMVIAVVMFCNFSNIELFRHGFQFAEIHEWSPTIGLSYHVGVDGINLGLIVMGAIVAFAATCVARRIETREKEFYILLMLMAGGILGAFASLDLVCFYFFHELALVPTFIMIGLWGRGDNKNFAAYQITLYLSLGALLVLIGLLALYLQLPLGQRTFDIVKITSYFQSRPIGVNAERWIFPLLLFGFGILVSLWPFHTWAPPGYGAAPTPTAMLHAGVVKKFGLYGLIRIALPLMPYEAAKWVQILAVPLPGQHHLLRAGGHAAAQFEPAHRQFQRGAHGLCLSRPGQLVHHWHHRHGADHGRTWFSGGADFCLERLPGRGTQHAWKSLKWADCCATCRLSGRS